MAIVFKYWGRYNQEVPLVMNGTDTYGNKIRVNKGDLAVITEPQKRNSPNSDPNKNYCYATATYSSGQILTSSRKLLTDTLMQSMFDLIPYNCESLDEAKEKFKEIYSVEN